ncbi:MAG: LPS assembly protein LptD [Terracidiphilus sp.]|jgi:LPS-assembly protein
MRPRNLLFITMLAVCHLQMRGQGLTNGAPPAAQDAGDAVTSTLPEDPGQEILPLAQPESEPTTGVPVEWEAQSQSRVGNTWTLTGGVVVHYRDYILHADKVVYDQSTTYLDAEGNLQVAGGPNDVLIDADHGDMRLNMHTARYFNVHGSQGVRTLGRTSVFSTMNPFLFTGRVLLQTGEGHYKIVDGTMTNCLLPRPDWQIIARAIKLDDGKASTHSAYFKFLGVPLFYLPYLRHQVDDTGRDSGFLIPVVSTGSSIRGYTFGEQVYWAISRSTDITVGTEYYSKRGWAPNGDFRYKGTGFNHATVRWNALLDRGVELPIAIGSTTTVLTDQGGVDIQAVGRKDIGPETRLAGNVEYLSSYLYRLVFNDNYWQAVSSEVLSNISLTHAHNGFVPSVSLDRFQTFAGTTGSNETSDAINGNEARILHLPSVRFDVLDRPLGASSLYWGGETSMDYLNRSEPGFHARNVGRIDFYPHLALPLSAGGWSVLAEGAVRETAYTISQTPDLTGNNCVPDPTNPGNNICDIPTISHDPLNRSDFETSVDLRAPVLERDFTLARWNRQLRHVIEPEITYRYVAGIGAQAQNVLLIDTTDIATNTNELGYSLTQRFYLRPTKEKPCADDPAAAANCPPPVPREWASWQIAQKFFIDPNFGGAVIPGRRNVFDSTLDLSGVAFLNGSRNLAPITSRLRFEAIDNLRVEWDMDYDPKAGLLGADNLFAGYSWGRTTVGIGHALLNAVDENSSAPTTIKSQQVQPFLAIGKPSGKGFNLAANGGYDFTHGALQYAGVQAVYNWNCCGLTFGYRRFALGQVRNETQYLYSFTLANFGSVGDVRRSNTAFRDPTLPPAY